MGKRSPESPALFHPPRMAKKMASLSMVALGELPLVICLRNRFERSENKLQSELDLAANCRAVTQLPEDRRAHGQSCSAAGLEEERRRVRQVEKLRAQLQRGSLGDPEVLKC